MFNRSQGAFGPAGMLNVTSTSINVAERRSLMRLDYEDPRIYMDEYIQGHFNYASIDRTTSMKAL